MITHWRMALPDPELEIRGEGGGGLPKNFFRPFEPQFGLKRSGGGGSPRAPPMDPPLNGTGWVVREAK